MRELADSKLNFALCTFSLSKILILHVHLFLSQLLECYVSLCEQLSAGEEEEHSNLLPSIAPLAQSLDSK